MVLLLLLACGVDEPSPTTPSESAACLASADHGCDDICDGAAVCSFDGYEVMSDCSSCSAEGQLLSLLCDEGSDASEAELDGILCNAAQCTTWVDRCNDPCSEVCGLETVISGTECDVDCTGPVASGPGDCVDVDGDCEWSGP